MSTITKDSPAREDDIPDDVLISPEGGGRVKKRFVRVHERPRQAEIMRLRLIEARIMNGLDASEAAKRMGYCNSTQLSLIESGNRGVPSDWAFLHRAADVYSVSIDYLTGRCAHPELDPAAGAHFAVMRTLEALMAQQAATMTTAFVLHTAQVGRLSVAELEAVVAGIDGLASRTKKIIALNPEFEDEVLGGVELVKEVEMLADLLPALRATLVARKRQHVELQNLSSGKRGPLQHLLDERQGSLNLEGE